MKIYTKLLVIAIGLCTAACAKPSPQRSSAPAGAQAAPDSARLGTGSSYPSPTYSQRDRAPAADQPSLSPPAYDDSNTSARISSTQVPAPSRGLGTEYGEQRRSHVSSSRFVRANHRPDVTLALWYNDATNVRGLSRSRSHNAASTTTRGGTFVLSIVDEFGQTVPAQDVAGRRYAIGRSGQRYQIGIENHSAYRYEVVTSVDGLDVIDGGDAGYSKRGYILDPYSSVLIEGWRTTDSTVAAFRFGALTDSYASRRGKPRNIGVVGAAFFHEVGGLAWDDIHRRHQADPFPGQYAPPPPPRW